MAIFDAFSDPRGVAATAIGISEEFTAKKPTAAASGKPSVSRSASPVSAADYVGPTVRASRGAGAVPGVPSVLVPYPMPQRDKRPSRTLCNALAAHTAASSSAAYMASHARAMAGLSRKGRKAATLKRRADDARVQQLRGIFAGHDSNRDGFLGKE